MKCMRFSRRSAIAGGVAAAASATLANRSGAAGRKSRPNIVFMMADDLGFADVGCYGRPDIATPHIDALAGMGIRLLQAYANSAVCSATRTALITGRYQYRLPVGLEEPIAGSSENVGLPPSHPTLPSLLRAAGYATMLIGKWHLGSLPDYGPLKSGYDHFFGFRAGALDYFTHENSSHRADLWDGDVPVKRNGYMTDLIGDRTVAAIDEFAARDRPFFLSVHFNAPHWPWEGPGDELEAERLRTAPLTHYDGGSMAIYRAMVERMDLQVGRIVHALDKRGLTRDTIVIFTSDNGGERFSNTWPFTGRKEELLEGGLRIPAIVKWPARISGGGTGDQVNISMDWVPTLLAAAGAEADPTYPLDGINLLPQLVDAAPVEPRTLFWRYKGNHQRACRDGNWKILKILDNTFLFDVAADPMERANLKTRHPDVYRALAAKWDTWNAGMLPQSPKTFTQAHKGSEWADHIGAKDASPEPDGFGPWPNP